MLGLVRECQDGIDDVLNCLVLSHCCVSQPGGKYGFDKFGTKRATIADSSTLHPNSPGAEEQCDCTK